MEFIVYYIVYDGYSLYIFRVYFYYQSLHFLDLCVMYMIFRDHRGECTASVSFLLLYCILVFLYLFKREIFVLFCTVLNSRSVQFLA